MRADAHYEYKYAYPIPMIDKYSSEKKKKKKNKHPYERLLFARKKHTCNYIIYLFVSSPSK